MYVITGATGNTGSAVANELLAKGQQRARDRQK